MTEKVKNILAKVFGSKYKGKEKSESTGTKLTESTGPVYYRTRDGISLVGENIYEKIKKEAVMIEEKRTKESKDKGEKSEEHDPIKHAKEKLELSSNIDFIIPSTDATNPFFYVRALSPEEAKKMIKDLQSNLENGYGIKIDLEKLEVEDKKYKS